ncbi:dihydroorotase [Syntrophomonas erecta]
MKLLIKGGQVIDPANDINEIRDVLIEDGLVKAVEAGLSISDGEILEAQGKLVCPGFIDMHVHLREPGFEYKEDIASGTRAAAAGGFTTVCCMPNTSPVIDNAAVASFVRERAQRAGVVNVHPIGAISKNQEGKELAEIAELVAAGCIAISDDGKSVEKSNIMRNALDYARMFDIPVLSHCEEPSLSRGGLMHEGFYSTIYGLKGIPAEAEEVMVARDILLARLTGARLHICHISTAGAVEMVRQAKAEGVLITCEATPHHLLLTDELLGSYNTDAKVNPPLRSQEHVDALIEGLNDGTIDCIATDHAPHHLESKDCEFELAANGISGLETAIPALMSLVAEGRISLTHMIELFTIGPAGILSLDRGTLSPGSVADLTIIDPEMVKSVDTKKFYSRGKNTPFKEREFKGWPHATIVAGRQVALKGTIMQGEMK